MKSGYSRTHQEASPRAEVLGTWLTHLTYLGWVAELQNPPSISSQRRSRMNNREENPEVGSLGADPPLTSSIL